MEWWTFTLALIFVLAVFSNPKETNVGIWTYNISLWLMMILITILVITEGIIH